MIDPLSLIPLHVETFFDNKLNGNSNAETKVADATAFVYPHGTNYYLVTNWHVVSGCNPHTGRPSAKTASVPNIMKVWFHSLGNSMVWTQLSLPLQDWETDEKLWKEHPRGKEIDVVVLPLDNRLALKLHTLDPALFNTTLKVLPSDEVSVIGFPFGLTGAGSLPIWKTGHVATDVETDYGGKPIFLIDGTFRPGMSGSPVIARRKEFISEDSRILITLGIADKFLGVFSGDISKRHKSEIGMVWKPELINEIIEGKDNLMDKIIQYEVVSFKK